MNLYDRIEGGIFGVAVGDALGVPVEFNRRELLIANPVKEMREYGTYRQPRGTWSDDSALTFCLMESLALGYDLQDIGSRFVKWYKESYWTPHGSVFDIGMGTRQAILEFMRGTKAEFSGGFDEMSNGNGSLMRILPMAFYLVKEPDINLRYEKVKVVSSITHGHVRSVIACFIYVEYILLLIQGKDKFDALVEMQEKVKVHLEQLEINPVEVALFDRVLKGNIGMDSDESIRGSGYVLHALEASFWAFLSSRNFGEAVLKGINLGEDTDTTGAITGGIAGTYYGFDSQFDYWRVQLARYEDIEKLIERFADQVMSESKET